MVFLSLAGAHGLGGPNGPNALDDLPLYKEYWTQGLIWLVFAVLLTMAFLLTARGRWRFAAALPLTICAFVVLGLVVQNPYAWKYAPTPAQLALMHELHICLDEDRVKVPADVVSSCDTKNVEILVGVSRDDLFGALGKPAGCYHADGSNEGWDRDHDEGCRDAVDVYYYFWPPCKEGPGPPGKLDVLFSSAGVVTRSRWDRYKVWNGPVGCIP